METLNSELQTLWTATLLLPSFSCYLRVLCAAAAAAAARTASAAYASAAVVLLVLMLVLQYSAYAASAAFALRHKSTMETPISLKKLQTLIYTLWTDCLLFHVICVFCALLLRRPLRELLVLLMLVLLMLVLQYSAYATSAAYASAAVQCLCY